MSAEILAAKLILFIFSVIVHEVMHGYVALKFDDRTALNAGRLTLNPLPHIDPIGTILMPLLLAMAHAPIIGAAKPVPVNPLNFSNIRQGELFVSSAGILANFGLAIIGTILFHLAGGSILAEIFAFLVSINLALGIFNLIPVPPLDGSKIVMSQLSYQAAQQYSRLEPFGIFILLGLIYFGILGLITTPLLLLTSSALGIPLTFF